MSCNSNPSNINQTFIIEPLSVTGGTPTISACTSIYSDSLISCSGDTTIFMGNGIISFNGNLYTNQNISATTINASTFVSGGTNLLNLISSGNITGGTFNNLTDTLTLYKPSGQISVTGFTDYYTTGATLIGNTVYFDRTDSLSAYTLNLNSLPSSNTYTTGLTFSNNQIIITRNDGVSLNTFVNTLTGLTVNGNLITNTISATTYLNLPKDIYVTGATYSAGTAVFTNNIGGAFSVSGFSTSFTGQTLAQTLAIGNTILNSQNFRSENNNNYIYLNDTEVKLYWDSGSYISSIYVDANGNHIESQTDNLISSVNGPQEAWLSTTSVGGAEAQMYVTVSGITSGIDVSGLSTQIYRNDTNPITINATDVNINGHSNITGTDGSGVNTTFYEDGSQSALRVDNTITNEFSTILVEQGAGASMIASNSGGTSSNIISILTTGTNVGNNGNNNSMIITDGNTSKGLVYANDYSTNFTPESLITKRYVSGVTTGITGTFTTGFTLNNSTYDLTIKRNDNVDLIVNLGVLASDVNITGGTYNPSNGVASFYNNTGGTFSITGFTTGLTDTTISSFSYDNANKLTINDSTGGTFNVILNTMTGLTVNGLTQTTTQYVTNQLFTNGIVPYVAGSIGIGSVYGVQIIGPSTFETLFGTSLSALTISATTYQNLPLSISADTYWTSGSTGNFSIKAKNNTAIDATGNYAVAEGSGTQATGATSHAEGANTRAWGTSSHAEGNATTASGINSHAEGNNTIASGSTSHAEGSGTRAFGAQSHAEGGGTSATGANAHAEGNLTFSTGVSSHAEGTRTTASGDGSHAEGNNTVVSGTSAHAEGSGTTASGNYSHSEGSGTTASGISSHAEGGNTQATGTTSHAEGQLTRAWGAQSHAEGTLTTASGLQSHAEGQSTKATGAQSHAEGLGNIASGQGSHAEGSANTASGVSSHAEGDSNIVSGNISHVEGTLNTSSGYASFTGGELNRNNSSHSLVHGSGNTLNNGGSFILSLNSILNGNRSAIIGGNGISGTSDDTVYVPRLNINITTGSTQLYSLGLDNNGFVITGLTTDIYVTGATYSAGTATFRNNTGGTFSVSGFSTGSTGIDTYVTGVTYTNNTLTLKRNQSQPDLSVLINSFTGLTATTISATTYLGLPADIRLTGGTYNNGSLLFTNNTGGTFSITGLSTGNTDTYVTGFTYSSNTFNIINNTGGTLSLIANVFTGLTINGSATVSILSATTYQNLPIDIRVTGGTYNNGNILFVNNTGGTFSVSGLSTGNTDTYVTGFTYSANTFNIKNNTGGTLNVVANVFTGLTVNGSLSATTYLGLPIDVRVTGGTYTAGTAVFTNNTGGTFSVSGFSSGTSQSLQSVINISSNITGGTLATTTGTSINMSGNVITLSATSVYVQGTPGNNANLIISSPTGSTTPTLSFLSNGGTSVGNIYGSTGILYLGGTGGYPLMIDNADIALPNQNANTLSYFDVSKRLRSATIGSGLTLSSGILTATGSTIISQNGLSSTGTTIELGGSLLKNTNINLTGFTLGLNNGKISFNTGDTSFYTNAGVVYMDIENYKEFRIRNSSIGFDFMQFANNTGNVSINGVTNIKGGVIPSGNVTLNVGQQGSGADATVSAIGVSKIALTSAGGGYGMYAIGSQTAAFYGMPTMRFNYDYASFGYTGDSNNGYRVGIGVDSIGTHRVNISDGLKVSGDSQFTNGLTATTISATTYQNLPIDVTITGGTYSSGTATFRNSTGGTFSVTGFSTGSSSGSTQDTYVTGFTYNNNNIFTILNNTGGTLSVMANMFSGLTATTISGGTVYGNRVLINSNTTNPSNPERLLVDDGVISGFSNTIIGRANTNNYAQLNITNSSSGNTASSDVVATADNGNETINFIDMGINSSTFNGTLGSINDAYLYSTGNNLLIGNASSGKTLSFFTDGTTPSNIRMTVSSGSTNFYVPVSAATISATTYYGDGANLINVAHTFTGTTTLDFGFRTGLEDSFTTTAVTNNNISSMSQVVIRVVPSTDHIEPEDSILDGLMFSVSDIVNGVGFNINASAINNTWGIYNINYKIIN